MTRTEAVTNARKQAASKGEDLYVFYDATADGGYDFGDEIQMDTYFLGCQVYAVITPDGEMY